MKRIIIDISNNTLHIQYKSKDNKIKNNLINTNVISNNELIFSEEYIKDNSKIISAFIKELCTEYNICKLIVKEQCLVLTILDLITKFDNITYLCIEEDKTLTYQICNKLCDMETIKYISCFNLPFFMIEIFDQNNIAVESRTEILFTSNFMELNNLSKYSLIFYKMTLKINVPMNNDDLEDFNTFCQINKYLKSIHINKFNKNTLENIVEILHNNRIKHIKIYIHDNINNLDNAIYLKEQNKIIKKKYKITYKIVYSDEYLSDNLFKQTILNVLKISGLLMTFLIIITISFILISNINANKKTTLIKNEVQNTIENTDINEVIEDLNISEEEEEKIINESILALKNMNEDTVGWLKLNNTNIDYPVVQSNDNNYYLKHNYNKEKDNSGWVFMDFKNDDEFLDKNTIFYAHNRYYSGTMFGTLYKTMYKSWYTNKDNQIISFDTMYESNKYQIFSIYKIKVTNDYLITKFGTNVDFLNFTDMLKKRSIYDFNVTINSDDEIITLSTCGNGNKRIVMHAVKIKD